MTLAALWRSSQRTRSSGLSRSDHSMSLVIRSSAAITKIEARNLLARFPHEAYGPAAELRQTACRRQALVSRD